MTDNREAMRDLLKPLVSKVPSSLSSASIQVVRDWKKLVVKAQKVLESNRSTYEQLNSVYTQLSSYK